MSRSCWLVGVEFHMLDARKECVPGFEDWSSGHIPFKTRAKMRVYGPSSFAVDDQYGALPFDKDKWAEYVANEIVTDLTFDNNRKLKAMVKSLLEQARAHCDEHHADIRERFKTNEASPGSDPTE